MKVDLKGQSAIVTGGGGCIGRAIAKALAQNGAMVAVHDINRENAGYVAEEITADGGCAFGIAGDVSNINDMQRLAKTVYERCGRIDILVNNAGINVPSPEERKPVHLFSDKIWDDIVSVDLNGVFRCSKPVIQIMADRGGGRIIHIGSVAGVVALRMQSAFVASKSGLQGLTRAMAMELAPYEITVNMVSPGSIINADFKSEEKNQSLLSHIPMNRQGKPEEIAVCVLFFASPEASYVTGQNLVADGGWTSGFMRDW